MTSYFNLQHSQISAIRLLIIKYVLQTDEGTYDVLVDQGSTSLSFANYHYDSALTASVDSISPSTLGVEGNLQHTCFVAHIFICIADFHSNLIL